MVHKYRPFCFILACRENKAGYELLLSSLRQGLKDFLDCDLVLHWVVIDHNQSAAATITEFEDETYEQNSKPALCWPHIIKNAVQTNRDKLKAAAFQVQAQEDLKLLHLCRSEDQFDGIATLVLQGWRDEGEAAMAKWLEKVYPPDLDKNWFVACRGTPGNLQTTIASRQFMHCGRGRTWEQAKASKSH